MKMRRYWNRLLVGERELSAVVLSLEKTKSKYFLPQRRGGAEKSRLLLVRTNVVGVNLFARRTQTLAPACE